MSESKENPVVEVFSLDAAEAAQNINYVTVKAHGGAYRLGSLTTDEVLDWLGEGKADDKSDKANAERRLAGLRLMVRCICDSEGNRYTSNGKSTPRYEQAVKTFTTKDAKDNKILIAAAMELNGMGDIAAALAKAKNA